LIVGSSKWPGTQPKERHVPISEERELEIERELGAIMRELDRRLPMENPKPKKPKHAVPLPCTPPLLLDFDFE
jgi:hypothetical protein